MKFLSIAWIIFLLLNLGDSQLSNIPEAQDCESKLNDFIGACQVTQSPTPTASPSSTSGDNTPAHPGNSQSGLRSLVQSLNISSTQSSTPTASPSSTSGDNTPAHFGNGQSGLRTKDRIIIGVTVPIPLVVLTILGIIAWGKTRRSKHAAAAVIDKVPNHSEDTQPYLQQKAELEAEERGRHELEALERVYEMTGEDAVRELPTGEGRQRVTPLQELRGAEHSKELEAPSNFS